MLRVYGASDDLIEMEGDIVEEFNPSFDAEKTLLVTSNGVALKITYDGDWHIRVLAGFDLVNIVPPNADEYTDTAEIQGPIEWVVCCDTFIEA